MEIGITGPKASILGGNECIIPRILVESAGNIVEFLKKIRVQDMNFIRSYSDYRTWEVVSDGSF